MQPKDPPGAAGEQDAHMHEHISNFPNNTDTEDTNKQLPQLNDS